MDPEVADSLQVSLDTLQVLDMQSDTMFVADADSTPLPKQPSFYVAVFTGVYMIVTGLIFWKTRKQAKAAEETAEASLEAAEAAKESNEIEKRASFYPILNVELDSHDLHFDRPYAKVTSVGDNVVLNAHLWSLIEYDEDRFDRFCSDKRAYENTDRNSLLWHSGIGNVMHKAVEDIETPTRLSGVHFLLKFRDALSNLYYRYQIFQIERDGTPVAQPYGTITTQMEPAEEYIEYAGENGIYFVPLSDIGEGGDVMTREEAKQEYPEPVEVFSDHVYFQAAGGLGPITEGIAAQKG